MLLSIIVQEVLEEIEVNNDDNVQVHINSSNNNQPQGYHDARTEDINSSTFEFEPSGAEEQLDD